MTASAPRSKKPAGADPQASLHRSGAVARMLRMPVATLRVWERRYALTDTALSPSGQRLYSATDVRRLTLLKQLTDRGHAIGSLAALDFEQLQRVASTHAQALAATQAQGRPDGPPRSTPQALRLVVVGEALGARLRRPELLRQLGRPVEMLGPFDDVAQAAAVLATRTKAWPVHAWLLHQAQLHEGWLADFMATVSGRARARKRAQARVPVAVLYGYAADAVCEALAAGGVTLLREPQPDVVLAQWLRQWAGTSAVPAAASAKAAAPLGDGSAAVTPQRWSDAALADFASSSTSVACECPRHVTELLMQLSRFEAYSAQCEQRNPHDAELHAGLVSVAAQARASFEAALERVALCEGLLLPASAP